CPARADPARTRLGRSRTRVPRGRGPDALTLSSVAPARQQRDRDRYCGQATQRLPRMALDVALGLPARASQLPGGLPLHFAEAVARVAQLPAGACPEVADLLAGGLGHRLEN